MTRAISRVALAAAFACVTTVVSLAQQTTSTETKAFEVLAVDGNQLVVKLPEGTRELTVPDDFRFTINGQQLSVRQLNVGMKGTATITTRTTSVPVTVTEVKNGTVVYRSSGTIMVRTPEGVRSFSQGDIDKRGVKIMKDGKVAQLVDLHEGDRLTATIITSKPPQIMTEKEVEATTMAAKMATPPPAAPAARAPAPPPATQVASATPAPAAQAPPAELPKTASGWPRLGLLSVLSLAIGLGLTIARRVVD